MGLREWMLVLGIVRYMSSSSETEYEFHEKERSSYIVVNSSPKEEKEEEESGAWDQTLARNRQVTQFNCRRHAVNPRILIFFSFHRIAQDGLAIAARLQRR